MKKWMAAMMIVTALFAAAPSMAHAEDLGMQAENTYQGVAKDSLWQRITDWIATVGKSDDEKARIIAERRSERNANKALSS